MSRVSSSQDFVSDAAEIERNAYNAAFYGLGLRWHWDIDTYNELQLIPVESDRVRVYLQTHQNHLLKAYDADFLVNAIETKKTQCRETMKSTGTGVSRYFNWAEACAGELGA